jgi:hypothetical protein
MVNSPRSKSNDQATTTLRHKNGVNKPFSAGGAPKITR